MTPAILRRAVAAMLAVGWQSRRPSLVRAAEEVLDTMRKVRHSATTAGVLYRLKPRVGNLVNAPSCACSHL